jgi:nucleoside phosphorylase
MTDTQHQIYVSYADADEDWVVTLVNNLKAYLRKQLCQLDDGFIWAKYMLKRHENRLETPKQRLQQSKYLLTILSPVYLKTIGDSEINLFNNVDNIFVVECYKTHRPEKLELFVGYKFWHEDKTGNVIRWADPEPLPNEREYYRLLDQMARDIASFVSSQPPQDSVEKSEDVPSIQAFLSPQCIVVTVTDTEESAFRAILKDKKIDLTLEKHEHADYWYNGFSLQGQRCALVRPIAKGNQTSQSLINRLLKFPPQLLLMSGVCGGFDERGVKLNDVIFTNSVFGYDRERISDEQYRRGIQPQVYRASPYLLGLIANFKAQLLDDLGIQIHHEKSFASGDKLLAQRRNKLRKAILDISPDICGVEMEGVGFFQALYDAQVSTDAAIIKAVSDLGDEKMSQGKDDKQTEAAKIAAQVTVAVIEKYFEN